MNKRRSSTKAERETVRSPADPHVGLAKPTSLMGSRGPESDDASAIGGRATATPPPPTEEPPSDNPPRGPIIGAAAAALLVLVGAGWWFLLRPDSAPEPVPDRPPGIADATDPGAPPVEPEPAALFSFSDCPPGSTTEDREAVRRASQVLDALAALAALDRLTQEAGVEALQEAACADAESARLLARELVNTEIFAPDVRRRAQAELAAHGGLEP